MGVPLLQESIFECSRGLAFPNEGNVIHFVHFHLCVSSSDIDKPGHNKLNQDLPEVSVIFNFRIEKKKKDDREMAILKVIVVCVSFPVMAFFSCGV